MQTNNLYSAEIKLINAWIMVHYRSEAHASIRPKQNIAYNSS